MNFYSPLNNVTMGGVFMFTNELYEAVNGFSNVMYGWGLGTRVGSPRFDVRQRTTTCWTECSGRLGPARSSR
jgi:hypothetical protein